MIGEILKNGLEAELEDELGYSNLVCKKILKKAKKVLDIVFEGWYNCTCLRGNTFIQSVSITLRFHPFPSRTR